VNGVFNQKGGGKSHHKTNGLLLFYNLVHLAWRYEIDLLVSQCIGVEIYGVSPASLSYQ